MDAEMIRAIGSCWVLALMVFLIAFIVIFRKPLHSLLERLTLFQVKSKDREVSIMAKEIREAEAKPEKHLEEEEATAEEQSAAKANARVLKVEPKTPDEWRNEMWNAFSTRT